MESLVKGAVLLASAVVTGCTMLPVDGPAPRDIASGAVVHAAVSRHAVAFEYALVDISAAVLDCLAGVGTNSIFGTFGARELGLPSQRVGVGDVIQVSIFEATAAGPFQSSEGGIRSEPFVTLPAQAVDASGTVTVPYAGLIRVAGRTTREIERDIEAKLASRAVEPQVVVSLVEYNTSSVSVMGDGLPGGSRLKLVGTGERILDVISRAGGTRFPGYELFVTLNRGNRRTTVPFLRLVEDPRENIRVVPGDTIYVFRSVQKFVAVGALGSAGQTSGLTGQFPFDQARLSLNEALAKAGSLQDSRADPAQVFIYREERRETLERMGADTSKFAPNQEMIPTVYRANYRDPSSFVFGSKFEIRNGDVIYAANSDAIEIVKFLVFVRAITSTVAGAATDVVITKDAITGRGVGGVVVGQ